MDLKKVSDIVKQTTVRDVLMAYGVGGRLPSTKWQKHALE